MKYEGHSRSNDAYFFCHILITLTLQNFAHVLRIITLFVQTYTMTSAKGQSITLDETERCKHTLLEDDYRLTVTDMRREMATCFSHEANGATIGCALQQLEMCKVCTHWVSRQLMEEHRKNHIRVALNFPTQYEKDPNDSLLWIFTNNESWIHFYKPERKSATMVSEKRGRTAKKIQ